MIRHLLILCVVTLSLAQITRSVGRLPQHGVLPSNTRLSLFAQPRPSLAFTTLDGRTADPCNQFTTTNGAAQLRDCQTVPDPQVTVFLPVLHVGQNIFGGLAQNLANGQRTLSLNGRGFENLIPANLRLSTTNAAAGCRSLNVASPSVTPTRASSNVLTFSPPASWMTIQLELTGERRLLCFSSDSGATYTYTGFKIEVTWPCNANVTCATKGLTSNAALAGYEALTFEEINVRNQRQTCCLPASSELGIGQCIFTAADGSGAPTSCCGGAKVEVSHERCCNAQNMWVSWLDQPCPCRKGDELNGIARCPSNELCCYHTKYQELDSDTSTWGECFNPTTHRCCRTGMRYDPGAQQCCTITGVQSLNVPCPCSTDEHCRGDSTDITRREANLRCCAQTEPVPIEMQECTKYTNYPVGTGPYDAARCNGKCMDPQYQICCNGVMCAKEYEKCCNATCCNRFTQTCEPSFRRPAPGNSFNTIDFFVRYEVCSTIEQMTPHKALWLFVYPTIWLLMTFLATGIVLVFANKASSRSYASIEQAIITVALLLVLFSLVLYFSPAFKYAIVVILVQLVAILSAASRVLRLNVVCFALHILLLLYLLDPFHGNVWFTFSYHRLANGRPDRETAGIMHTVSKMWKSLKNVQEQNWCPEWYLGYGRHDELLRDTDRFDNPDMPTFAYCNRSYIALLQIFAAIILLLSLVQLMLVFMALLLRFTKPSVKLIVREEYDNASSSDRAPLY